MNRPIPLTVFSREEPIELNIYLPAPHATTPSPTSSSSLFPLPVPPCLASPSGSYYNTEVVEGSNRFFKPPHSPLQPKEESASSPSTTVAALEEALSEGTTEVEGGVIVYEKLHLPLPEDLEVGGWTHLCDNIVNYITRRIHNNPDFFPTLALQFEGQDTIFREDQRALEGLHIVCR